jgi:hypothetical protein
MTPSQRLDDAAANVVLAVGLDDEQRPQVHSIAETLRVSVVRRQRARWLVCPMTTESYGDGGSWGAKIGTGSHDQLGLLRVGRAHEFEYAAGMGSGPVN